MSDLVPHLQSSSPPARPAVVLHIEPDAAGGRMLASVLRDVWPGAFDVVHVGSLAAAVARLQGGGIDCVLLGERLPDAGELEALDRLARRAPRVPVVVFTDSGDEDLRVRAVRAGAQDFLSTGTDGYALGRALRYAVERKRREILLARRRAT
ncbi:MAG TPA: response regulator [Solirubrobacteraceae bacterium]